MARDEAPTLPPSTHDEAALEFGRRVSDVNAPKSSGLLRELAEAWAELENRDAAE